MFDFFKTKKNYENISSSAFKAMISENPDTVIIDVRTALEFKQGSIPKAINIDLMDVNFSQKMSQLAKDKTYLVYCRSGNRSGSACKYMGDNGFEHVYNLSGGIMSY